MGLVFNYLTNLIFLRTIIFYRGFSGKRPICNLAVRQDLWSPDENTARQPLCEPVHGGASEIDVL